MPRVLLVEDHPRMTEAVAAALQAQGIACDGVGTLRQAAAFVEAVTYDALILDRGLPDGDGLVLLAQLRALRQSTPCLGGRAGPVWTRVIREFMRSVKP